MELCGEKKTEREKKPEKNTIQEGWVRNEKVRAGTFGRLPLRGLGPNFEQLTPIDIINLEALAATFHFGQYRVYFN